MKVLHLPIGPSVAAAELGRRGLPPELLASIGAKYSRSQDGVEALISQIDFGNFEVSIDTLIRTIKDANLKDGIDALDFVSAIKTIVESINSPDYDKIIANIFKHTDYGHQSIMDMAPVSIFMDGVSISTVSLLWQLCTFVGGQEASTRFIDFSVNGLQDADLMGIAPEEEAKWREMMDQAFSYYKELLDLFAEHQRLNPTVTRIPSYLQTSDKPRAKKEIERIQRNYAFDRARVFLPAAAKTNVMMVMPSRGWIKLYQQLESHPLKECQVLAHHIKEELLIASPQSARHSIHRDYWTAWWAHQHNYDLQQTFELPWLTYQKPILSSKTHLQITEGEVPLTSELITRCMAMHENRYAPIGSPLDDVTVTYGWDNIGFAELRDVMRHRTGKRRAVMVPTGFNVGSDEIRFFEIESVLEKKMMEYEKLGVELTTLSRAKFERHDPGYFSWALLGTEIAKFRHTTDMGNTIYTMEIRTGYGTHFRYVALFREVLQKIYKQYPVLQGLILEGDAEPE